MRNTQNVFTWWLFQSDISSEVRRNKSQFIIPVPPSHNSVSRKLLDEIWDHSPSSWNREKELLIILLLHTFLYQISHFLSHSRRIQISFGNSYLGWVAARKLTFTWINRLLKNFTTENIELSKSCNGLCNFKITPLGDKASACGVQSY